MSQISGFSFWKCVWSCYVHGFYMEALKFASHGKANCCLHCLASSRRLTCGEQEEHPVLSHHLGLPRDGPELRPCHFRTLSHTLQAWSSNHVLLPSPVLGLCYVFLAPEKSEVLGSKHGRWIESWEWQNVVFMRSYFTTGKGWLFIEMTTLISLLFSCSSSTVLLAVQLLHRAISPLSLPQNIRECLRFIFIWIHNFLKTLSTCFLK